MTSLVELNQSILRAVGFTEREIDKTTGPVLIRLDHNKPPVVECRMYARPLRELTSADLAEGEDGERHLPVEDLKFKLVPIEDGES